MVVFVVIFVVVFVVIVVVVFVVIIVVAFMVIIVVLAVVIIVVIVTIRDGNDIREGVDMSLSRATTTPTSWVIVVTLGSIALQREVEHRKGRRLLLITPRSFLGFLPCGPSCEAVSSLPFTFVLVYMYFSVPGP